MGKQAEWELGDAQKRREKAFRDWFEDRLGKEPTDDDMKNEKHWDEFELVEIDRLLDRGD